MGFYTKLALISASNFYNQYQPISRQLLTGWLWYCVTMISIIFISATILNTGNWLHKLLSDMNGKATGNESFTDIKVFLYSAVSWCGIFACILFRFKHLSTVHEYTHYTAPSFSVSMESALLSSTCAPPSLSARHNSGLYDECLGSVQRTSTSLFLCFFCWTTFRWKWVSQFASLLAMPISSGLVWNNFLFGVTSL